MHDTYENPLVSRYASKDMSYLFSDEKKFTTWRKLWIALAEAEAQLGLPITKEQIDELKEHVNDIDYEAAKQKEKEVRHDVMAHVLTYGACCPKAKPIIHLGATSCFVGDNTDILVMKDALDIIERKLLGCLKLLADFSVKYAEMPMLGYTHLQPAQLVTVGKRGALWLQEFLMDFEQMDHTKKALKLRGAKGTTGTQASFLELFEGDTGKVSMLDKLVTEKLGYDDSFPVTGQTYPRKLDTIVLNELALIAQSAYKFGNDLRMLQHLKEIEEPFESKQIGSSAMAYKRNPMRSERICALSRYVMTLPLNTAMTASTQWFERTLDDSANKRIVIAQAFLGTDAILNLMLNVLSGLVVYEKVINKHIMEELPFMATENILMDAVKNGGDRQELHEKIRQYSIEAGRNIKELGGSNNLIDLIKNDDSFKDVLGNIDEILDPKKYVGMAPKQTVDFVENYINPILKENEHRVLLTNSVNV